MYIFIFSCQDTKFYAWRFGIILKRVSKLIKSLLLVCIVIIIFLLQKASQKARELGIPRLYISANSGARIGLAEEIKHIFNIAWIDPENPDKASNHDT